MRNVKVSFLNVSLIRKDVFQVQVPAMYTDAKENTPCIEKKCTDDITSATDSDC